MVYSEIYLSKMLREWPVNIVNNIIKKNLLRK